MKKQKVYAVQIKPSYLCNQDCIMCPYHEKTAAHNMTWAEIKSNLEFARANFEFDRFDVSGGEPTIYKYFFDTLDWLKANLPATMIYITTNAIRFADADFAKKMSKYNITCYVSFHNPDEEVSRIITQRKNHHAKLLAALANLKKYKIPLEVTVTLTKLNQDRLDEINKLLSGFPIQYLTYRLPNLVKKEGMKIYKPDICGLMDKAKEAKKSFKLPKTRVEIDLFPLCFYGTEKLAYKGYQRDPIIFINKDHQLENYSGGRDYIEAIDNKYFGRNARNKLCGICTLQSDCPGIDREYLQDMKKAKMKLIPPEINLELLFKEIQQ
jgi:MoaA/NifB/PqqE/SkfB family radical SAM enzyme